MTDQEILSASFKLPCGAVLKNRICKSAMSENMAAEGGAPSKAIVNLYNTWAESGAGLLISGNVMVDPKALGERNNVVIEDESHLDLLKEWATKTQRNGSALWMQINHPGRQAPKFYNKDVVAPSAVGLSQKSMFTTPRALEDAEILELIERYGKTAFIAQKAGFKGVQIHAAHGYLASQFLSSRTNIRTDRWGGSLENRARFVLEVFRNIRKKVGPNFPIGIKLNSADFQRGAFTEEESLEVIKMLSQEGIDLIEISGGTYEKAAMMGRAKKTSTLEREAYFADFIVKARQHTSSPLMLTGGFRTFSVMADAIRNNELDIIGLARCFARNPRTAADFFSGKITNAPVPAIGVGIRAIDNMGFLDTIWHEMQLHRMGKGLSPNLSMSAWKPAFFIMKEALRR